MLTYQSQARFFKVPNGTTLTFPSSFEVKLKFGPPQVFGAGEGPLGFLPRPPEGAEDPFNTIQYNANTGRMICIPKKPMPALDAMIVRKEDGKPIFELKGNVLRYFGECANLDQLGQTLAGLSHIFTSVLNLYFADPPVVLNAGGTIGSVPFEWLHFESVANLPISTPEEMEEEVLEAFNHTLLFNGTDNRRLAAALQYFYIASRLFVAGNSQWEFMAEHVLNLSKSLEVMFSGDRDKIRKGLARYGYSREYIESEFMPVLLLRSHFDVAHARMAIMKAEQLRIVYRYLANRLSTFRELFKRISEGVKNGSLLLPDHGRLQLDNREQRQFDQLVESMAKSQSVAQLLPPIP